MKNGISMTLDEVSENSRLKEIGETMQKLVELCADKPAASIICSISVPDPEEIAGEGFDVNIMNIYVGDTVSLIQQFDSLADHNPQFLNDLTVFLDLRIKRQMAKAGTTGNAMADQMLADLNKDELPN